MKNMNKEQGVTLVELLVAVAILAVGLIPLVRVLMYGLETGNRANKMTISTNLARDLTEEIRSQAFSEEFVYPNPQCNLLGAYPDVPTVAQCVGRESGEDEANTLSQGGRIEVFDDVDDYDGWCRGRDCSGQPPLETYDGYQYDGAQGYPPYRNFTRRVRIHNLDVGNRHVSEFIRDPFASYTSTDSSQLIRRYDFNNWTALTEDQSGNSVTGLSPLKRIEVIVTYEGPTVKSVGVTDISYAVMPSF